MCKTGGGECKNDVGKELIYSYHNCHCILVIVWGFFSEKILQYSNKEFPNLFCIVSDVFMWEEFGGQQILGN